MAYLATSNCKDLRNTVFVFSLNFPLLFLRKEYLNPSSRSMQTGWIKGAGKWYYMDSTRAMQTGKIDDNGVQYIFSILKAINT